MSSWQRYLQPAIRPGHDGRWLWLLIPLLVLCCMVQGRPAYAEPGRFELGLKLAPSLETQSGERDMLDTVFKLGGSIGVELRYGLFDWGTLQTELLYATRGAGIELQGDSLGGLYFTYVQLPVLARVGWRIPPLASDGGRPPLAAYLVAGPALGVLLTATDVLSDGGERPLDVELNRLDVSLVGGLGLAWDVTPDWAASLEVRGDLGLRNAAPGLEDLDTKNRTILLTLGISRTFNDNDGDGVIGSRDRCPDEGEDWNGSVDDGCPDADPDEDTFVGKEDACPKEAEDINKYEDDDGCPDGRKDKDKDGVVDKDDKCVDKAFPYNKDLVNDRRGCPPDLDLVSVGPVELKLTPALEFDFGQAKLTDQHKLALDQVVKLLHDYYPDMQLRIEGHSDSKPGKNGLEDNRKESERRAQAVLTYLLETGVIDSTRLQIAGLGDDTPRAVETADGRQRSNRRVDLLILPNPKPLTAAQPK